jgi:Flp pilus assembly protein TadD
MIFHAIVLSASLAAAQGAATDADSPAASPVSPASSDGAISSGILAFKKRNFARAEDEFEKAVEANPQSAAAHFYLGYTIYKRTEPKRPFHPDKQKAADEFKKAFDLDPAFTPDWGKVPARKMD